MRITGIRITNYGRFKGDHELDLKAGVYAIVAQLDSNAERSNWLGKTSFLTAIRWALYGAVSEPWRSQDDVISRGERELGVDLELSDGTFISRTKTRGSSAKLRVLVPHRGGAELELFQEQAQKELIERIGMHLPDFDNTVWMGQKVMSRMVRSDPAERTRIINEWLQLGALEKAVEIVTTKLSAIDQRLTRARIEHQHVSELCRGDRVQLTSELYEANSALDKAKAELSAYTIARIKHQQWTTEQRARTDALRAAEEVAAIEAGDQPQAVDAAAMQKKIADAEHASEKARVAIAEMQRLSKLRSGDFDGQCPVTRSQCPVADQVVGSTCAITTAYEASQAAVNAAIAVRDEAIRDLDDYKAKQRKWLAWSEQLKRAIAKADTLELRCQPGDLGPEPQVPPAVDIGPASARVAQCDAKLDAYDKAVAKQAEVAGDVTELETYATVHKIALQILGKNGAQRRITERAVGSIATAANQMLTRCGVDLQLSIEYGRELQEIATVCQCGAAFPRSAAVKKCDKCGAVRGRKREDKMRVELSSTSGAAEDLAGVALQMAAAQWRRVALDVPWSVVALDEPLAACDAHNRRSMLRTLAQLTSSGFEQAFVVAHSSDILEAVPNRLIITADDQWSRIQVG